MQTIFSAIMGIVQGLTEFLPVSSSGHLLVAEKLLDVKRDFPVACVWCDRGRHLLPRLPAGKIGAVVYADPFVIPAEPPRAGTQGPPTAGLVAPGSRASGASGGLARDDR